jgi:putative addiction module component (TIGR02574 family)
MTAEFAPLFNLPRAERLQLVTELWDSIAREDAVPAVSAEKTSELRRRRAEFLQAPETGRTWEQVKQRARRGHD